MEEIQVKNICLFGPQGSGKGTQAEKLADFFGIAQISPGNIFRKAVAEEAPLGKQVDEILKAGNLVPDEITNELIRERLEEEDCIEGFILDGYPRNAAQADALDAMTVLTHVIVITIPDEESIHRLSRRRVAPTSGITYHLDYKKPKVEGICDVSGEQLVQRNDDKPEAIKKRLEIYHAETEVLFDRYRERNIFYEVDGMGSIEEIWERVKACII